MWLTCSSIGRKLVMAITGACLVLFVTFHVVMNAVCILWPTAYNEVCMFLGANWYALIASVGLAALFIIHIAYAIWLTIQNKNARGPIPYEVTSRPPQVEWSSKNMLVLGFVIFAFLIVHMIQFWAKMQLQELIGGTATVDGIAAPPEFGTLFIQAAFSQIWVPIVYIIGFIALWFHMNHGFWSMFHTVGWDNNIWIKRLKNISCVWTSCVVALFIIEAIVFAFQAHNKFYFKNEALQNQYAEVYAEKLQESFDGVQAKISVISENVQKGVISDAEAQNQAEPIIKEFYTNELKPLYVSIDSICPKANNQTILQFRQTYEGLKMQYEQPEPAMMPGAPAADQGQTDPETAKALQEAAEQEAARQQAEQAQADTAKTN